MGRQSRCGFTLVELLVVVTILGILIGLLLPAVQSSREAARMTQVPEQPEAIGLALQSHAAELGTYPSNGWGIGLGPGIRTAGLPKNQPGGWLFNVLPYIELKSLHDMGANGHNKDALGSGGGADRSDPGGRVHLPYVR